MASGRFEDACDRTLLVVVDGAISSGKTTLGELLMRRSPKLVHFFCEVGHLEKGGENPVDIFLRDPERNAAIFQMLMHALCYNRHEAAIAKLESALYEREGPQVVLIDRSLPGNAVFAVTNHRLARINADEFSMYRTQCLRINPSLRREVDMCIYLWVCPLTCMKRNHQRNAKGETELEAVTYDTTYFWDVEKSAFASLLSNLSSLKPRRQLIVNWHDEYSHDIANFDAITAGYLSKKDEHLPLCFTLSYDHPALSARSHTHTFDFHLLENVGEFFSPEVITKVMDAVAYTTSYDGPRSVFIRLPKCVTATPYTDFFPLTIV